MPGDDRGGVIEEGGIDPALEAAARVAGECERLSGQRDELGREIGDFDKNVERKSVEKGTSVSVRVDLGGRRIIKIKTLHIKYQHILEKQQYLARMHRLKEISL